LTDILKELDSITRELLLLERKKAISLKEVNDLFLMAVEKSDSLEEKDLGEKVEEKMANIFVKVVEINGVFFDG